MCVYTPPRVEHPIHKLHPVNHRPSRKCRSDNLLQLFLDREQQVFLVARGSIYIYIYIFLFISFLLITGSFYCRIWNQHFKVKTPSKRKLEEHVQRGISEWFISEFAWFDLRTSRISSGESRVRGNDLFGKFVKIALYSRYSNNKCGIVMNIVRNFTIRPNFAPKIISANCPSLINNFSKFRLGYASPQGA